MPATAERLAALETMVGEIHSAVVGDGSKDSSMRERVATLEAQQDWKHRAVAIGAHTLWTAAVAAVAHTLGIQLPIGGGHA